MADFVSRVTGISAGFGPCVGMAVIDGAGKLVAGVVFHNWHPDAGVMEVSAAAVDPKWATRAVLTEGFNYVFGRAGCQAAVARTDMNNARTRRLWKALGAQEIILPRLRGRDADEALLVLTDDAWKTSRFRRRNGKIGTFSPAAA